MLFLVHQIRIYMFFFAQSNMCIHVLLYTIIHVTVHTIKYHELVTIYQIFMFLRDLPTSLASLAAAGRRCRAKPVWLTAAAGLRAMASTQGAERRAR